MTQIEAEILESLKGSYRGGKSKFKNTYIDKSLYGIKIVYVKVGGEDVRIFVKTAKACFYNDPMGGKNKLINERLRLLKEAYPATEVSAEILSRFKQAFTACDAVYGIRVNQVVSSNGKSRFFATNAGAEEYRKKIHGIRYQY